MAFKSTKIYERSANYRYWQTSNLSKRILVCTDYFTEMEQGSDGTTYIGSTVELYGTKDDSYHDYNYTLYVNGTVVDSGTFTATYSGSIYEAEVRCAYAFGSAKTVNMRLDLTDRHYGLPAFTGNTKTITVPYAVEVTRAASICYVNTDIDHGIDMASGYTCEITVSMVHMGSRSETLTYNSAQKKATWHPYAEDWGPLYYNSLSESYTVTVDFYYGDTKVGAYDTWFRLYLPTPNTLTTPGNITTGDVGQYSVQADIYTRTITVYAANRRKSWELTEVNNTWTWAPTTAEVATYVTDATYTSYFATVKIYCGGDYPVLTSNTAFSTLTLKAADIAPELTVTVTDSTGLKGTYGKYILGKSKLRIAVAQSLKYSATAASFSIEANGNYYSAYTITTSELASMDYDQVVVSLQDSRGMTATVTVDISILEWYTPRIIGFSIHRTKADGSADDSGAYCRIDWSIQIAPLENQNSRALTITHPEGSTQPALTAYEQSGSLVVAASTESSYDITLALQDDLDSFARTLRLSTAGVALDILRGGKGLGLGKVAELSEAVEVNPDWTLICQQLELAGVNLVDWMQQVNSELGL